MSTESLSAITRLDIWIKEIFLIFSYIYKHREIDVESDNGLQIMSWKFADALPSQVLKKI